jgi:hypothetical protein
LGAYYGCVQGERRRYSTVEKLLGRRTWELGGGGLLGVLLRKGGFIILWWTWEGNVPTELRISGAVKNYNQNRKL